MATSVFGEHHSPRNTGEHNRCTNDTSTPKAGCQGPKPRSFRGALRKLSLGKFLRKALKKPSAFPTRLRVTRPPTAACVRARPVLEAAAGTMLRRVSARSSAGFPVLPTVTPHPSGPGPPLSLPSARCSAPQSAPGTVALYGPCAGLGCPVTRWVCPRACFKPWLRGRLLYTDCCHLPSSPRLSHLPRPAFLFFTASPAPSMPCNFVLSPVGSVFPLPQPVPHLHPS